MLLVDYKTISEAKNSVCQIHLNDVNLSSCSYQDSNNATIKKTNDFRLEY